MCEIFILTEFLLELIEIVLYLYRYCKEIDPDAKIISPLS